jgi:hypothetical protein
MRTQLQFTSAIVGIAILIACVVRGQSLRGELGCRDFGRVGPFSFHEMNVTVPESGGDGETRAIQNGLCPGRCVLLRWISRGGDFAVLNSQ